MADKKSIATTELRVRIAQLQAVQKSHPPQSPKWRAASKRLQPLVEEMARREVLDEKRGDRR